MPLVELTVSQYGFAATCSTEHRNGKLPAASVSHGGSAETSARLCDSTSYVIVTLAVNGAEGSVTSAAARIQILAYLQKIERNQVQSPDLTK
jgi:hypothetical protein